MPTFGHKLRYERESRNTRIQDVSARTHIGLRYLEALENNDFDALPGPRGFGKLYIRAYAEMLGFDPQPLIEEYEKERRRRSKSDCEAPSPRPPRTRRIHDEPPPREPVQPEPEATTTQPQAVEAQPIEPQAATETEPRKRHGGWTLAAALITVTLLIVAAVALRSPSVDAVITAPLPATAEPTADPVPELPLEAPPRPAVSGGIRVTESGIGNGVEDHRLVGQGTRFKAGSTVFFFSRAIGAAPGEKLRHVWLHEGRVIQRIELVVGSANWRTYSNKTLWKKGNWSVEARSADDRVLARADFICEAP